MSLKEERKMKYDIISFFVLKLKRLQFSTPKDHAILILKVIEKAKPSKLSLALH